MLSLSVVLSDKKILSLSSSKIYLMLVLEPSVSGFSDILLLLEMLMEDLLDQTPISMLPMALIT